MIGRGHINGIVLQLQKKVIDGRLITESGATPRNDIFDIMKLGSRIKQIGLYLHQKYCI